MAASIEDIREYWGAKNIPQQWYSTKEPFSLQWYNDLAKARYSTYYEYIPKIAEFNSHPGERVLEVGVGIGTDLVQYAVGGAEVYGVDLGEDQIRLTELNFAVHGLKFAELRVANAEGLPYADEFFDLVYSFGVLHHTSDTQRAIDEVNRVLKQDGQAIVMLYARGWKHYVKRCLIQGLVRGKFFKYGRSWQAVYNDVSEVNGGSPQTGVYTRGQVEAMFSKFPVVEIRRMRLGEFIDYAPYATVKVPLLVKNFLNALVLENLFGENWIIKVGKYRPPTAARLSDVVFKHY